MDDKEHIKSIIKEISDVTLGSKKADLRPFFHEQVQFVAPDLSSTIKGRDAALNSYREFRESSEVHSYEQGDPDINLFGTTAVVTYPFAMRYTFNNQTSHESGRDLMVMIKQDEQWQVVWRTLLVLSSETQ